MTAPTFLNRVEEIRRARGVSYDVLLDSAVDLFSGEALTWFRSIAKRVHFESWDHFTRVFLKAFLPPYYQRDLEVEIYARKQGPSERFQIYLPKIELFDRLPEPFSETKKLSILRGNARPAIQHYLSVYPNVVSIDESALYYLRNYRGFS